MTPNPKSAARGGPAYTSIIDPQRPRTPHPDFELDGLQTQLARWDNEGGAGRRPTRIGLLVLSVFVCWIAAAVGILTIIKVALGGVF